MLDLLAAAGVVGFGIGGLSMFRALPLLGAPLASLANQLDAARDLLGRGHARHRVQVVHVGLAVELRQEQVAARIEPAQHIGLGGKRLRQH